MDIDTILETDGNVYRTIIPEHGLYLSYRLLTMKEYKVFRGLRDGGVADLYSIADLVFERCFIGNASLISVEIPAGITISIGNLIMYLSGDCDDETLKDDIRRVRQLHPKDTVFEHMRAVICTAFDYKIEEIDSWTRPEFFRKFAISENVLGKQNPEFVRLNLSDIKSQEDLAREQANPNGNIDFARENRELSKNVGRLDQEEANLQLSKEQLARLSRKSNVARGR